MAVLLRDLVGILGAEARLYRDLLQLVVRERSALMASRLEEFVPIAAEKETLIERLQTIESRRADLTGRLAAQVGCRPTELTVSLLARSSPEPYGSELSRQRTELLGLIDRLQQENRRSEVLCRHAGELMRASYGVVKGLAGNGPVYQRGGRLQGARLNGKLLRDEF